MELNVAVLLVSGRCFSSSWCFTSFPKEDGADDDAVADDVVVDEDVGNDMDDDIDDGGVKIEGMPPTA